MNSEAQKLHRLSVTQTRHHEWSHADFFHVVGHFEFEFAEIADEVGDSLFVRFNGLQAKSVGLFRATVHAFRGDGFRSRWDCQNVSGRIALPTLRIHRSPNHLAHLMDIVPVSWFEGSFEASGLVRKFCAETSQSLQTIASRLDEGLVLLNAFGGLLGQYELEIVVTADVFRGPADEGGMHCIVVRIHSSGN